MWAQRKDPQFTFKTEFQPHVEREDESVILKLHLKTELHLHVEGEDKRNRG